MGKYLKSLHEMGFFFRQFVKAIIHKKEIADPFSHLSQMKAQEEQMGMKKE